MCRGGGGSECGIYALLIITYLCIGTNIFYSGGRRIEYEVKGGGVIEVIKWLLV